MLHSFKCFKVPQLQNYYIDMCSSHTGHLTMLIYAVLLMTQLQQQ